ncbi:MAG: TerC family protein [Bacteroidota bacterium]
MDSFSEQLAHLATLDGVLSLLTLTLLEIVLGIDNIIFISIIAGKLRDKEDQRKARSIGLILALLMRVGLLFAITWIISLKTDLFTIFGHGFSGRDIILFAGGVFLLAKTTSEIHEKMDEADDSEEEKTEKKKLATVSAVIMQIVLIDIVFSFDSILTAVGIVDGVLIMIIAVIISMIIMFVFAEKVSDFINAHPTLKMLALAFLLMIGALLVMESFDVHVPKQYVYSSMAFAFLVEMLNMRMRRKTAAKKKAAKDKIN